MYEYIHNFYKVTQKLEKKYLINVSSMDLV